MIDDNQTIQDMTQIQKEKLMGISSMFDDIYMELHKIAQEAGMETEEVMALYEIATFVEQATDEIDTLPIWNN